MKCPHCGQEHPDNTKFCPETGLKIEIPQSSTSEMIACNNPSCVDYGKKILPPDSKFCPTCGKSILCARKVVASYRDNNGKDCQLDNYDEWNNNDAIIFEFGNWIYTNNSLLLKDNGNIRNLGKYDFAVPYEEFLFAIKQWEENIPFEIYTKDGKCHSSSNKYGEIEDFMKDGICMCKISKNKYGIVDIQQDKIIQVINDNPKQCGRPALNSKFSIVAYAISGSMGDYIIVYDKNRGTLERINRRFDFVREDYYGPRCELWVISDNYLLVNESTAYSCPRDYYVINRSGNICFKFEPKSYPKSYAGIVAAYNRGFFNGITGRGFESIYTANFIVNSCLVYGKQIGEKSWQQEYGILDINTDKTLLITANCFYPVLDNNNEVRCIFSFGYSKRHSVVYDTIDYVKHEFNTIGDELQVMGFFNGFFNLCTGEYASNCFSDRRKQDITIYSTIYDQNWNVVFEDRWGKFLGVFGGYSDNKFYALSKSGDFGFIQDGVFCHKANFSYKEMYRLLPLFLIDRFLIYHADGVVLIDLDGNIIKELDDNFNLHQFEESEDKFSNYTEEHTLFMSYRKVVIGRKKDTTTGCLSSGHYLTNLETGYQYACDENSYGLGLTLDYSIRKLWSNVYKF